MSQVDPVDGVEAKRELSLFPVNGKDIRISRSSQRPSPRIHRRSSRLQIGPRDLDVLHIW
jgi:hypothetical protein